MDTEADKMPSVGGLKPIIIPSERKKLPDARERIGGIPALRGINSNHQNLKSNLLQDESHPLTCTLPKNSMWRLESESPTKINISQQKNSLSPVLKPLVRDSNFPEKSPTRPQMPNLSKNNGRGLTLKLYKSEMTNSDVKSPEKIPSDRNVNTLNPRMLGQKLESLSISPVLDKKGASLPGQNEFTLRRMFPFDADKICESIQTSERDRLHLDSQPLPEILPENISYRRKSCDKYPNQTEEKKRSSLKLRFIDAKTQEAELGRRLLPQEQCPNKKRRVPASVLLKQISSKNDQESNVPAADNLIPSKKYQSPVVYEIRNQQQVSKSTASETDEKKNRSAEETLQEEYDQSTISIGTSRGAGCEQSDSISGSKESESKRRSASLERNCSFILRKERHLRKASVKNLSVSYSSNNSESSCTNNNSVKVQTGQTDSTSPGNTTKENISNVQEASTNNVDQHSQQENISKPISQGLFPSNNNSIAMPVFKESKTNNSNIQVIKEEAAEEKSSNSGVTNTSEIGKKENEKFGKVIEWRVGGYIGSGSHSEVYSAMEIHTGRIIAVKKMMCIGSLITESMSAELSILQKLKHENIVQYLGHEVLNKHLYIYMEHVAGGSLPSIYGRYGALHEKTIKIYAKQILSGLQYLHENNVIHKDIKGGNILIQKDGIVKLSDFGCSSEMERTLSTMRNQKQKGIQGSVPWMAPEVVKETGYGRRSDIWSFGCTILEMATGKCPWSQYNFENEITLMMKIALTDEIPEIPETLSEDLKDFIRLCLRRNLDERPYAGDLLKHKFLTG